MILQVAGSAVLALLLIAGTITDIRQYRLYDVITLPLVALGLLAHTGTANTLGAHLLAVILAFGTLWMTAHLYRARTRTDGLGLGDAKLFAAAGAWLGPLYLAPVLLCASLLALAAAGVFKLGGKGISMRTRIPFGPFLSIAFFAFWLVKISNDVFV